MAIKAYYFVQAGKQKDMAIILSKNLFMSTALNLRLKKALN